MEFIRVSSVLSLLFPGSLDFVEEHHLDRGTHLHEQIEYYVNNQIYGYAQDEIDPGIQPVVDWIKTQNVEFVAAEERVNHQYGYTGKPDVNVIWNGKPWIWDWKFSQVISEQNKMQLNAYMKFEGHPAAFIQCNKEGKVRALKCQSSPCLWAAFLAGLSVKKFHLSRGFQ